MKQKNYKQCKGCRTKIIGERSYCQRCVKIFHKKRTIEKFNNYNDDDVFADIDDYYKEDLSNYNLKLELGIKQKELYYE